MRTNIDIDDRLLKEAMKATGQKTKKATVEEALREIVKIAGQRQALKELQGIGWDGDLDEMRQNFFRDFSDLPHGDHD
ncbi:MAG: type II toxin-antitoxin system VapB family antitoxin [Rhizobiaceae bacterium]|jgi:Arc/MetJ family transcription regulator